MARTCLMHFVPTYQFAATKDNTDPTESARYRGQSLSDPSHVWPSPRIQPFTVSAPRNVPMTFQITQPAICQPICIPPSCTRRGMASSSVYNPLKNHKTRGVNFGRRLPHQGGQYSTPINNWTPERSADIEFGGLIHDSANDPRPEPDRVAAAPIGWPAEGIIEGHDGIAGAAPAARSFADDSSGKTMEAPSAPRSILSGTAIRTGSHITYQATDRSWGLPQRQINSRRQETTGTRGTDRSRNRTSES